MTGTGKEPLDLRVRILAGLAGVFIRVVEPTIRLKVINKQYLDTLEDRNEVAVLPFFHGRLFLLPANFAERKIAILASMSRDGEIISRVLLGFGFHMVRGSTSRGGAKGLLGLKKALENGFHVSTPVDGPRGPKCLVKPGVVYLAKRSCAPVLLVATSTKPAFILKKAWDEFMVPLPFSRGVILYSEPFYFDSDISEEAVERDRLALERAMIKLYTEADRMAGYRE